MEFFDVADSVAILFLLSVVGYLSFVAGVLDRPTTIKISRFVLNVALPALILASLQLPEGGTLLGDLPGLAIAIVVFYAVSLVAAWVVPRILRSPSAKTGVFRFTLIFSNVAFMGFPIVESLFGRLGLAYAALFNLPFRILIFTFGVLLMTEDPEERKMFGLQSLANPGIVASVLGVLLIIASIRIPSPFIDVIDLLGSVTTPLAMVIVGSLLASYPARDMLRDRSVFVISAVRLVAIPVAVWLVLRALPVGNLVVNVVVTLAAMPAAVNCVLFACEYGSHPNLASRLVFVSTLCSVLTVPLVAMLFL